jgi:hypothetical protein
MESNIKRPWLLIAATIAGTLFVVAAAAHTAGTRRFEVKCIDSVPVFNARADLGR